MSWDDGQLRVGLGVCAYNRPERLRVAAESVDRHIRHQLGVRMIYDDGSTTYDDDLYTQLAEDGWYVMRAEENLGVATSKNRLLEQMMGLECDMIVLMEDDIEVISPDVLNAYATAIHRTGIQHLNFAHHGSANIGALVEGDEIIETWQNVVGAWSVYTRRALEVTGNFDTEFRNDLDHVHHTYMVGLNGLTTQWRAFADVRGSDRLLREQPGAIEDSTLGHEDIFDVDSSFQRSLRYWIEHYPVPNDMMWLLR